MNVWAGLKLREAGRGFTLLELLLAAALLVVLLGALVFNFANLERGVRLEEGSSQLESLLRFARAYATGNGREVRVVFEESPDPADWGLLGNLRVMWEPDPMGAPGALQDLPQTRPHLEHINDLVQVESVRRTSDGENQTLAGTPQGDAEPEPQGGRLEPFPPIRFYPDGSSDSVELVLLSRDEQDKRRAVVSLVGLSGLIKRSITDETGPLEDEGDKPPTNPAPAKVETAAFAEKQTSPRTASPATPAPSKTPETSEAPKK